MMNIIKSLLIVSVFSLATAHVQAQTIVVNPDGTHTIAINHGATSTIINSNGTHSHAINHGNHTVIVNPNGTHSTAIHHGGTSTIVNPDGTHSTAINHGNTSIIVNPDGSHSTVHHGNASTLGNSHVSPGLGYGSDTKNRRNSIKTNESDTVSVFSPIGVFFKKIFGKKRSDRQ